VSSNEARFTATTGRELIVAVMFNRDPAPNKRRASECKITPDGDGRFSIIYRGFRAKTPTRALVPSEVTGAQWATVTDGDEVVWDSRQQTTPEPEPEPPVLALVPAVIEPVEGEPVEGEVIVGRWQRAARDLDTELRSEVRTFVRSMDRIINLIALAKTQRIHEALGFASWTAYIIDVIAGEMRWFNVETRRVAVKLLAGEGMSDRAIGEALGASHTTINRDRAALEAEQVEQDVPPESGQPEVAHDVPPVTVTGKDGKQYPKPKPKPDVPKPKPKPTPEPMAETEVAREVVAELLDSIGSDLGEVFHLPREYPITDEVRETVFMAVAEFRARLLDIEESYRR
jgi:hypothetical protein